jgi:hypothetical protein
LRSTAVAVAHPPRETLQHSRRLLKQSLRLLVALHHSRRLLKQSLRLLVIPANAGIPSFAAGFSVRDAKSPPE